MREGRVAAELAGPVGDAETHRRGASGVRRDTVPSRPLSQRACAAPRADAAAARLRGPRRPTAVRTSARLHREPRAPADARSTTCRSSTPRCRWCSSRSGRARRADRRHRPVGRRHGRPLASLVGDRGSTDSAAACVGWSLAVLASGPLRRASTGASSRKAASRRSSPRSRPCRSTGTGAAGPAGAGRRRSRRDCAPCSPTRTCRPA